MFSNTPQQKLQPDINSPAKSVEPANSGASVFNPYADLNQLAGNTLSGFAFSSSQAATQSAASLGPLTIQAPAPAIDTVVLPGGSSVKILSPGAISGNFGNRPDSDRIQVEVHGNAVVLKNATAFTDNGDGSLQAQGKVAAFGLDTTLTFPDEKSVVRFDGLPVWIKEGSLIQQVNLAQAA